MKSFALRLAVLLSLLFFAQQEAKACHAIALVNFNQQTYTPGQGLFVNAASDSPTCGCGAYWLDMEIRCNGDIMNGTGLTAGVWDSVHCFPYFQSPQMFKTQCQVQNYPGILVPDSILCPGITYQYRLRENHNGAVGPWTGIMTFTMPGTPNTNFGHLDILASPNPFCINTQLDWVYTAGNGCSTTGCNVDTTFQWESLAGDPIIVGSNFSCDTCPYPTAWPSQPTTYALTIIVGDTNACGYGVYTQTPVTVIPLPWPTLGTLSSTINCNTGDLTLTETGSSGNLQWQESSNGPGGPWTNIPGATNSTLFIPGYGGGLCYRLEVSTSCDVLYTNEICPLQGQAVTAGFSASAVCENNLTVFTDLSTSGGGVDGWKWDFGDGSPIVSLQNPDHVYTSPGNYTVTLIASNITGCADTISIPVTSHEKPAADIQVSDVCADGDANFSDASTIGTGAISAWDWDLGGVSTSNQQNPVQNYITADQYNIVLIVTSDQGCMDTATHILNVYPNPVMDFSANAQCQNDGAVPFTNLSTIAAGSIDQWDWDFGDLSGSSIQTPTHLYTAPGTYNVTLIGTSNNGCSDTITTPLTIFENPVADFGPVPQDDCGQVCVNFLDESTISTSTIVSWDWDLGNGNSGSGQALNECYDVIGGVLTTYDVTLVATSAEGCADTISVPNYVTVYPQPIADFTPQPQIANEYNASIDFDNNSIYADDYYWTFGDGDTSIQFEPTHHYNDTGVYTVWLVTTTANGCIDSISNWVEITPVPSCNVPNAFSPNGDGLNDVFKASLYGYADYTFEMMIFDRGGDLIFQTKSPYEGWDGRVKGIESTEKTDVYVWKILITDSRSTVTEEYVGHVTVFR